MSRDHGPATPCHAKNKPRSPRNTAKTPQIIPISQQIMANPSQVTLPGPPRSYYLHGGVPTPNSLAMKIYHPWTNPTSSPKLIPSCKLPPASATSPLYVSAFVARFPSLQLGHPVHTSTARTPRARRQATSHPRSKPRPSKKTPYRSDAGEGSRRPPTDAAYPCVRVPLTTQGKRSTTRRRIVLAAAFSPVGTGRIA